mmetsp:Transcript_29889/g.84212  ORF Transcript_29889/g.84212 Transcript_29889/m.84212 type:complete len:140 (-) Transcript_29889:356-775(-)
MPCAGGTGDSCCCFPLRRHPVTRKLTRFDPGHPGRDDTGSRAECAGLAHPSPAAESTPLGAASRPAQEPAVPQGPPAREAARPDVPSKHASSERGGAARWEAPHIRVDDEGIEPGRAGGCLPLNCGVKVGRIVMHASWG